MTVRIKPVASLLIAAVITASTFGAIGRSACAQADVHRTPMACHVTLTRYSSALAVRSSASTAPEGTAAFRVP